MDNKKVAAHTRWEFVENCSTVLPALECNSYQLFAVGSLRNLDVSGLTGL